MNSKMPSIAMIKNLLYINLFWKSLGSQRNKFNTVFSHMSFLHPIKTKVEQKFKKNIFCVTTLYLPCLHHSLYLAPHFCLEIINAASTESSIHLNTLCSTSCQRVKLFDAGQVEIKFSTFSSISAAYLFLSSGLSLLVVAQIWKKQTSQSPTMPPNVQIDAWRHEQCQKLQKLPKLSLETKLLHSTPQLK